MSRQREAELERVGIDAPDVSEGVALLCTGIFVLSPSGCACHDSYQNACSAAWFACVHQTKSKGGFRLAEVVTPAWCFVRRMPTSASAVKPSPSEVDARNHFRLDGKTSGATVCSSHRRRHEVIHSLLCCGLYDAGSAQGAKERVVAAACQRRLLAGQDSGEERAQGLTVRTAVADGPAIMFIRFDLSNGKTLQELAGALRHFHLQSCRA